MEIAPEQMKVVYNLAITYEKLQAYKRAEELFSRVAEMEPKTSDEEIWVEKAKNKIQGMSD